MKLSDEREWEVWAQNPEFPFGLRDIDLIYIYIYAFVLNNMDSFIDYFS
jgi:hypothetical protein